ncbi:hypothetical protein [Mycobacterium neumannii]|uniref:hypothetical protein n=1 Tax=Mycobacterium neumannii TaxID=2048551 RepID=UPI003AB785E4
MTAHRSHEVASIDSNTAPNGVNALSRTPIAMDIPAPPIGVQLSPVANKTATEAVEWYRSTLSVSVTTRYLKSATEAGELRCQIIAGKRRYSTAELYRFIVTRPSHTAAKKEHTA